MLRLMRQRHEWLIYALGVAALCGSTAQPVKAGQQRMMEVANAAIQRDLVYKRVNGAVLALDLYRPQNVSGLLPVIVCIHGGHFGAGRKERCPAVALVQDGYAVASIDYRLTSIAPFPAQIEDCKAAVRWLRANASSYHLDPNRIGVWGYSGVDIWRLCWERPAECRNWRGMGITCSIRVRFKRCATWLVRQIYCLWRISVPKECLPLKRYSAGRSKKMKRRR